MFLYASSVKAVCASMYVHEPEAQKQLWPNIQATLVSLSEEKRLEVAFEL